MVRIVLAFGIFAVCKASEVPTDATCAEVGGCGGAEGEEAALLQSRSTLRGGAVQDAYWKKYVQDTITSGRGFSAMQRASYESCTISETEDCSLAKMKKPTLVYPGGKTQCINGDKYAFSVVPGAVDKLLYFFQGGGACWEANGAYGKQVVLQCTDSMAMAMNTSGVGDGVQDVTNDANPFKDYTVVEPFYCSGDAFMGDTTMTSGDTTYKQTGYANADAAFTWAKKNLKGELQTLVVGGFSAGTLGTMAWADTVLGAFSYKKGVVLMDSYAGVFPTETQGATLKRWGACDKPILSSCKEQCESGQATVQEMLLNTIKKYPDVAFANIQSKEDGAQVWFYIGMAQSWGKTEDMAFQGPDLYKASNTIFGKYSKGYENYVVYYVDGWQHCYTQSPSFYTATTTGSDSTSEAVAMVDWVTDLVTTETVASECAGKCASFAGQKLSVALP